MQKIVILGSTGSVGRSTVDVALSLSTRIQVFAIASGSNIERLEEQARKLKPEYVAVYNEEKANELRKRGLPCEILSGMEGLCFVAGHEDVDAVVCAISGFIGIQPTLSAIKAGKRVCLANKEVLISAGSLVKRLAKQSGAKLLPVDSEHSALFQALQGENIEEVSRLIITASGGPFRNRSKDELQNVSLADALKHPSWDMGAKITIDSSTLMNKGLEVIEANVLFDTPAEKIDVVIHPQSIIHSMIEFCDGSTMAQWSDPDMKLPIQYALTYPKRVPGPCKKFDFTKAFTLEFFPPDMEKFPCLRLAFEALRSGGSAPCYLNAANEVLVDKLIHEKIRWIDIPEKLEMLMANHISTETTSLEEIMDIDKRARDAALNA